MFTSLREIDRFQAVYPIPGQELKGNNYGYTVTPEPVFSYPDGAAAEPEVLVVPRKRVWVSLVSF